MVAYADLGGLGAKQGVPVGYDWVQPSLMPQVLPWLAILALLMLKPNRCASAWWILVPLACVGGVASLPEPVRQLLPSSQFEIFLELKTLQIGVFLAASVLVIAVALALSGLVCRGRYCWLRLSLWLMAALVVVWLLVIGPFFMIAVISSGGSVPVLALFGFVGGAAGITFGVLLPFLVLSFVNGFYRERLKGLLHLGDVAQPPIIAPPMPAVPGVAEG
ncbi:MAG: hypothetical protein NT167_14305 [Verrucomicrobia bacterium]|nr:hypothetical protein [Verrucomicrobiota bacterium]